jgi:hypothetical protein
MNIEAPGQADEYLLQALVGVSPPRLARRNVVQEEHSPDAEWHVTFLLEKRQVSSRIRHLREIQ